VCVCVCGSDIAMHVCIAISGPNGVRTLTRPLSYLRRYDISCQTDDNNKESVTECGQI